MADKATTTEVEETEETVEENPEAELEADDEGFEDAEDNSEEESDEEAEEEASDTEDEPEDEAESKDEEEPKPEEKELTEEEKRKQHNREMAEQRIKTRQEREASLKKDQQDYVAQADKDDPRDQAVRQLQVDAYNNRVDSNTNKLTNGYERAMKDFDILRDPSPEIQAEVDAALDAFQAMSVTMDQYGNPVEVRGDLYAYLQRKADSITALTGRGARAQEQNKAKQKAKTTPTPTRAPKEPKKDPDLEAFDEEANRY